MASHFLESLPALSPTFPLAFLPSALHMVASVVTEDRTPCLTWPLRAPIGLCPHLHAHAHHFPQLTTGLPVCAPGASGPLHKLFRHLDGSCLSARSQLKCHSSKTLSRPPTWQWLGKHPYHMTQFHCPHGHGHFLVVGLLASPQPRTQVPGRRESPTAGHPVGA